MTEKDIFGQDNEVRSSWIKWGKIGDKIAGTLVSVRQMESQLPGKKGEMVNIYEILASGGEFHDINDKVIAEEATVIEEGQLWLVGGGLGLDNAMRNIKLGQKIGIKFTEEKPTKTKGFNPTKVKKVYSTGEMNQKWLDDQAADSEIKNF